MRSNYRKADLFNPGKLGIPIRNRLSPVDLVSVFLTLFFSLSLTGLAAQPTRDALFDHYELETPALGHVSIHVTKEPDTNRKKPLLLYLDGSGNWPIFYKKKSGKYGTSVSLDVKQYARDYHVVLISKPGVPLSDSLQYTDSGREYYPTNSDYEARYSLAWRAESAAQAIDMLLKKLPVDTSRIIVMGYSEGSQVAPRVAVLNRRVTHVVCFVGNALDQFYDFLLEARLRVEKNEITSEQGQAIVDSLYTQYEKIYKAPTDTAQRWYGATYQKWASFGNTAPIESMLRLTIPILYVAGGRDRNQPILAMDYARLAFIRQGKTNLTYKVYPNCDHYMQEKQVVDGQTKNLDRLDEAHQFALDWTNQPN